MHRRQPRAQRQGVVPNSIGVYEQIGHDIKCIGSTFERLDGGCEILCPPDGYGSLFEAERAGRRLNLTHLRHADATADAGHDQPTETGNNLAQEVESLAGKVGRLV